MTDPQSGAGYAETAPADAALAILPGMVADAVVQALGGATVLASQSAEQGELVKALCAARPRFETIERSRTATVEGKEGKRGYKYSYSTLGDAIGATADALAAEQLAVFQSFEEGRGSIVIVTDLVHSSNQWRRTRLTMPVIPGERGLGPQQIGSAITYGRRYSYLAMLGIAPEDDDDGKAAQESVGGVAQDLQAAAEAALALVEAGDAAGAFAAARKLVEQVDGCGAITEPRLIRLRAIADKSGWGPEGLDRASRDHLGKPVAELPWKVYDLYVELFRRVRPQNLPAPGSARGEGPAAPTDAPTWRGVWDKLHEMVGQLQPGWVPIGPEVAAGIHDSMRERGWEASLVTRILSLELGIDGMAGMPKDGTQPPLFRGVAKAFRVFGPDDVPLEDRNRYGMVAPEQEPPFGEDDGAASGGPPTVAAILDGIRAEIPTTLDEAWRAIAKAHEMLKHHQPEAAAVAMPPDDRLTLFKQGANGGRPSGAVCGLVHHYLGCAIERAPSALFPAMQSALQGFPATNVHREELLLRLPVDPAGQKPQQLADVLRAMIGEGIIDDDDVKKSGAKGATRDDLTAALRLVADRIVGREAGGA